MAKIPRVPVENHITKLGAVKIAIKFSSRILTKSSDRIVILLLALLRFQC